MRSVADIGGATGWGQVRPPTPSYVSKSFGPYRKVAQPPRFTGRHRHSEKFDLTIEIVDDYLLEKKVNTVVNPDPALRTEALEQLLTERRVAPGTDLEDPMSPASTTLALDTDETSSPPRANGELVFAEPWESRAFGMAVSLHDAGLFAWPQFQAALIARIAAWENHHPEGECYSYYTQWLGALEDVLAGDGTVFTDEVVQRAAELAIRPAGHDHTR